MAWASPPRGPLAQCRELIEEPNAGRRCSHVHDKLEEWRSSIDTVPLPALPDLEVLVGRFLYFESLAGGAVDGTVLPSAARAIEPRLRRIEEWTDALERRAVTIPTVAALEEALGEIDREIGAIEEAEFSDD
jgi:DNA-binding transcriptional MerR regulator